jgi:hypothetical protein
MPASPSRRAVLATGMAGVGALALSACGIRLEDDAPRVPLIPTRTPVTGEAYLIHLWLSSGELAEQAKSLGGASTSLPARLAAVHRTQSQVWQAELLQLGVPQHVLDEAQRQASTATRSAATATAGSSSSGPRSETTSPVGGPLGLAAAEAQDLGTAAFVSAAAVTTSAVPLAGSTLAQRAAAAALLGVPVTAPVPAWTAPSLAASFLESTRAAVYGFQVVAAQSPTGAQRTLSRNTLAQLQARAQAQESLAGSAAGPPALGYPLPFPVTTPTEARRLAVELLTELRAALARDLGSAARNHGPFGSLVHWLADTEVLASRWGVLLAPFPGLQ